MAGRPRDNLKRENYSPWCSLTLLHMERLGMSNTELATMVRSTPFVIHAALTGRGRPPLELAVACADAFNLKGNERESYIIEAHMAHSTPEIRALVSGLRRQITQLTVAASGKSASPNG